MAGSPRRHLDAAARHDRAAVTHDTSAAFWKERGDAERAALHRDAAAHERAGAALERRWAKLIAASDAEDADREQAAIDRAHAETQRGVDDAEGGPRPIA